MAFFFVVVMLIVTYHKNWSEESVQEQGGFDDIILLSSQVELNLKDSINSIDSLRKRLILRNYFNIGDERYDFLYDYFKTMFKEEVKYTQGSIFLFDTNGDVEISSTFDHAIYDGEVISKNNVKYEGKDVSISVIKSKYNNRTYISVSMFIRNREFQQNEIKAVIPFVTSSMSSVLNPEQSIYIVNKDGGLIDFIGSASSSLKEKTIQAVRNTNSVSRFENELITILDIDAEHGYIVNGFALSENIYVTISSKVQSSPAYNSIILLGMFSLLLGICAILIIIKSSLKRHSDSFNKRIKNYFDEISIKEKESLSIEPWYSKKQKQLIHSIHRLMKRIHKYEDEIENLRKVDSESGIYNSTAYELEVTSVDFDNIDNPSIFRIQIVNSEQNSVIEYKESKKIIEEISREVKTIEREIKSEISVDYVKLFRLGYRVFSFHISGLENSKINLIANKIHDRLSREFVVGETVIEVNCFVGVVNESEITNGKDILTWHDFSVNALDYAKITNEKTIIFNGEVYDYFIRRESIEADLTAAIIDDELYLVYEPIYNLKTGKLELLEVTPQWNHPFQGHIGTDEIVRYSLKLGIMDRLIKWVITSSFLQTKSWEKEGFRAIKTIIGVDFESINSQDVFETITSVSNELDLSINNFVFSVQESEMSKRGLIASNIIKSLKRMGASMALSEVASKEGSFSYNSVLSIDSNVMIFGENFINSLLNNSACSDVLVSMCEYNKKKGGFVIVKGLEKQTMAKAINELGVDYGSGNAFDGPKTGREIVRLFNSRMTIVK